MWLVGYQLKGGWATTFQQSIAGKAFGKVSAVSARPLILRAAVFALEAHHARPGEESMVNATCGHDRNELDGHVVHHGEDGLQAHAWIHGNRRHLHAHRHE
jgi:hypothetical protein